MQIENDNDLYGGQSSSEFKCGKLCDMTFMEVKGHQSSNVVNYVI